jgi:TATA-binding protein-associated factor
MKSPDESLSISGEFPNFSVKDLMERGTLLLASSGKEFAKPSAILANSSEVKQARQEAMGRLGLDFLNGLGGDDMEWEKELVTESAEQDNEVEDAVKTEEDIKSPATVSPPARSKSSTPAPSAPSTVNDEDLSGLSARERNRLKRKRKVGNTAFVSAPLPPQSSGSKYTAQPSGQLNKYVYLGSVFFHCSQHCRARLITKDENGEAPKPDDASTNGSGVNGISSDKVIIDPSKGGAVNPKNDKQSKALEVQPGCWIWDGIVKLLEVDLFSLAWEARHGAAMALRELLKLQGKYGGTRGNPHLTCLLVYFNL